MFAFSSLNVNLKKVDHKWKLHHRRSCASFFGLRVNIARARLPTWNISGSSCNIYISNVGFCIETFEMIHTWSEWDTARPTIPGLRVPFAITERIEAARTMPLPRNSKFTPSHLHKKTSQNQVNINIMQSISILQDVQNHNILRCHKKWHWHRMRSWIASAVFFKWL